MKATSRRKFLSQVSKAGVGMALVSSVLPESLFAANAKPKGKIGVALMGLGGFSKDTIAPEIIFCKNVWFAGVITGDPEGKGRAWAKEYGFPEKNIYHYDQIAELRNNPDIDFVHIVTPNGLHAKHTIEVAKAGKHILCEKPMAITSDECRLMISECKKAGVLLGINYRLHWEPHHLKMMELTKNKTYGNLKSIDAEFSWKRGDNKPWLLDKKMSGGGAFFDTGVYTVQAGCYLTNEKPTRVTAIPTTTRDVYPKGIEETMTAIIEYPSGVVMAARASYASQTNLFNANCENGNIICDSDWQFGQSYKGKPSLKSLKLPNNEIFKANGTLQLAVILDAFADSIANKTPFKTPGEMGLRDIVITEAVYRSASSGKTETIVY
jgi:glucose-fructose oxidoreductase